MDEIRIIIKGDPVPMGSKIAGITKYGKPYLRDSNASKLRAWQKLVADEARLIAGATLLEGPIEINLFFRLRAPRVKVRELPHVKPDLDKLIRGVMDAVTYAEVYKDDAQVCSINATKTYAQHGQWPGVTIIIKPQ